MEMIMDIDEALEIIEKTDRDFDIKNPIYCGLQILVEFTEGELHMRFEHDQMWAGDFVETVKNMRPAAVEKMTELGWFEAEDSWSHYA
jgi:hypothetical protein